jgi:hypothetical protein
MTKHAGFTYSRIVYDTLQCKYYIYINFQVLYVSVLLSHTHTYNQ